MAIISERKTTLAALGKIPYGNIADVCFNWCQTMDNPPSLRDFLDEKPAAPEDPHVLDERRATMTALSKTPLCDIAMFCYRWYYNNNIMDVPLPLQTYIDTIKAEEAAAEAAARDAAAMTWKDLEGSERVFPAGKYYIGDLCYALDRVTYEKTVCDGGDGFMTNGTHTLGFFSTYAGDGGYEGTNGKIYGVDAGIIGIVPVEIVEDTEGHDILTFENDFTFGRDNKYTFYIKDAVTPKNSFEIPTGPTEDEESEDE
jgi:hypothetical protein